VSEEYLDTEQAASFLGYKRGTLENWRLADPYKGPKYIKPAGKVLYSKSDLEDWVQGIENATN